MRLFLTLEGRSGRYVIGYVPEQPTPKQLADAMRQAANEMELWAEVKQVLGNDSPDPA